MYTLLMTHLKCFFFKLLPKKITEETLLRCRISPVSVCLLGPQRNNLSWKTNPVFSLSLNGTKLIYTHRTVTGEPSALYSNQKKHLKLHKTCYGMLRGGSKDKKREGDDNRDG